MKTHIANICHYFAVYFIKRCIKRKMSILKNSNIVLKKFDIKLLISSTEQFLSNILGTLYYVFLKYFWHKIILPELKLKS